MDENPAEVNEETDDSGMFMAHAHCDDERCSNITVGIINPTMVESCEDHGSQLIPTVSMDALTALSIARGILEIVEQQVRKNLHHGDDDEIHGAD